MNIHAYPPPSPTVVAKPFRPVLFLQRRLLNNSCYLLHGRPATCPPASSQDMRPRRSNAFNP